MPAETDRVELLTLSGNIESRGGEHVLVVPVLKRTQPFFEVAVNAHELRGLADYLDELNAPKVEISQQASDLLEGTMHEMEEWACGAVAVKFPIDKQIKAWAENIRQALMSSEKT